MEKRRFFRFYRDEWYYAAHFMAQHLAWQQCERLSIRQHYRAGYARIIMRNGKPILSCRIIVEECSRMNGDDLPMLVPEARLYIDSDSYRYS